MSENKNALNDIDKLINNFNLVRGYELPFGSKYKYIQQIIKYNTNILYAFVYDKIKIGNINYYSVIKMPFKSKNNDLNNHRFISYEIEFQEYKNILNDFFKVNIKKKSFIFGCPKDYIQIDIDRCLKNVDNKVNNYLELILSPDDLDICDIIYTNQMKFNKEYGFTWLKFPKNNKMEQDKIFYNNLYK